VVQYNRSLLTLVLALTVAGSALAPASAQSIGDPAPDFTLVPDNQRGGGENSEKAVKLSSRRGMLVVLYFWRPSDPTNVEGLSAVAKANKLPGVEVFLLSTEKAEDTKRVLDSFGESFEHSTGDAGGLAQRYDVSNYPRCYLLDPNGFIAWRGHPGELEERIKDQIRLTPPAGANPAALKAKIEKSAQALKAKKYGVAFTLANQVVNLTAEGDEIHTKAVSQRDEVEKAIEPWLAEARKLADAKKFEDAARIVATIKVRMDGRDAAKPVEEEITRLRGSRDSKAILETALRDARAELQMEQAAELLELKRFVDADRAYREIIERFEDAPAAEQARAALKAMRQDAQTQKVIDAHYSEMEAERWLSIADRFARLELNDQAKEYYEKVLSTHPKSDAAKRASANLKKLGGGKKKKNS
jgi:peroxiredoxin